MNELAEDDPEVKQEEKCICSAQVRHKDTLFQLFAHYSSFEKLQVAVAWLLCFKCFLYSKLTSRRESNTSVLCKDNLTKSEMQAARKAIFKTTQVQAFADVLKMLPDQRSSEEPSIVVPMELLKKSTALKEVQALSPFVVDGWLRVGGRLRNADLEFKSKYPLLLPYQHRVTDLMIQQCHEKEGHLGVNHVLAELNKEVWIIKGRAAVKRVLNDCVSCRFWRSRAGSQQMGNLPPHRVKKSEAFQAIGTDMMGPLMVTAGRSRLKRYVCIFNCMATRAVHLEVVPSLDVNAFLQAYRRFCSRRNVVPSDVYSDNGGCFVAAEKELKGIICWHFNPPRASHQGGFYKVFFKLFRKLFRTVVASSTLTDYDFQTYVCEVERILNNRPITALPSSRDDWTALTPNAILTGSLADDVPPDKFLKADAYRNSWKKTQYPSDKFWQQWLTQYLPLLQPKQKWFGSTKNFQVGDFVLMLDENYPRGQWPKALVTDVMPDKAGLVRRVRVRTADGAIYCRDIRKLCLLEGHTT